MKSGSQNLNTVILTKRGNHNLGKDGYCLAKHKGKVLRHFCASLLASKLHRNNFHNIITYPSIKVQQLQDIRIMEYKDAPRYESLSFLSLNASELSDTETFLHTKITIILLFHYHYHYHHHHHHQVLCTNFLSFFITGISSWPFSMPVVITFL
jgi:hypothetical protein